jgi:hypothetical protein
MSRVVMQPHPCQGLPAKLTTSTVASAVCNRSNRALAAIRQVLEQEGIVCLLAMKPFRGKYNAQRTNVDFYGNTP